jgi:hypothetical protein
VSQPPVQNVQKKTTDICPVLTAYVRMVITTTEVQSVQLALTLVKPVQVTVPVLLAVE